MILWSILWSTSIVGAVAGGGAAIRIPTCIVGRATIFFTKYPICFHDVMKKFRVLLDATRFACVRMILK